MLRGGAGWQSNSIVDPNVALMDFGDCQKSKKNNVTVMNVSSYVWTFHFPILSHYA